MTGERDDDDPQERPWHERTSTVVGASAAGLAVIGILFFLMTYIAREFDDSDQAPQYYLDPGGTSSYRSSSSSATSTTSTVTTTSPPVTTDINPSDGPPTSGSETSGSETPSGEPPTTRRTPETDDDEPSTTRSRPRLNETRTLYPRP